MVKQDSIILQVLIFKEMGIIKEYTNKKGGE